MTSAWRFDTNPLTNRCLGWYRSLSFHELPFTVYLPYPVKHGSGASRQGRQWEEGSETAGETAGETADDSRDGLHHSGLECLGLGVVHLSLALRTDLLAS